MRKLATIRKIANIKSIPNADKIELAIVDGWQCVVEKDKYKIGQNIVYFEIDSFLPEDNIHFEFLRKRCYVQDKHGDFGFRLRTQTFKGQISQGLVMPIDIVPDDDLLVGDDVTSRLNVVLYEEALPKELEGTAKGYFPRQFKKTDLDRIQNLYDQYETLKQSRYVVTEKLNGYSCSFYWLNENFGVCSKDVDFITTEDNVYTRVAKELNIQNKLRLLGVNLTLQGELIGEGICGNPYNLKGKHFRLFNVFFADTYEYAPYHKFEEIARSFKLETVPFLDLDYTLPQTVEELLAFADGSSVLNPKARREGLVFKTDDGKTKFKVISNKHLLKEK